MVIVSLLLLIGIAIIISFMFRKNFKNNFTKNMNIVDKMYISADKCIFIILVNNDYYMMSWDKSGIKLIDKLENFEPVKKEQNFGKVLKKAMGKGNEE